jgi:hypothetical protein
VTAAAGVRAGFFGLLGNFGGSAAPERVAAGNRNFVRHPGHCPTCPAAVSGMFSDFSHRGQTARILVLRIIAKPSGPPYQIAYRFASK